MRLSLVLCLCLGLAVPVLMGCAGVAPVPGGSDSVNPTFYATREELLTRLKTVSVGMTEDEVMNKLGRKREELSRLKRNELLTALTGTDNIEFNNAKQDIAALQSLYGYRLDFKSVVRKHGFTSPIRIRTDEKGFDYNVILIFHDSKLCAEPILSGGVVDRASSGTFFDFLNPGTLIDRVGR